MKQEKTAPSRFGTGVLLEARVICALRDRTDSDHAPVLRRLVSLTESGVPMVVSYLSLAESFSRLYGADGGEAASNFIDECREIFNIVLPLEDDVLEAEEMLRQGVQHLSLEQAVAGIMARRLGCSIYGFSPAFHLFHVAVLIE